MVIQTVPDYVILEVPTLAQVRETICRSYEHLPDVPPEGMVEEDIDDVIDRVLGCLEQCDGALQNLRDMCESQCMHDAEFDQGEFKLATRQFEFGEELLNQFHHFRMYYAEEYLPFFYKECLGHDCIILQRVGYTGQDDE